MKAIFSKKNDNISTYRPVTRGWEFHKTVDTHEEFYSAISEWEDNDFFPQDDGTVLNGNTNPIYDPEYPNMFEMGDYDYYLVDMDDLNEDQAEAMNIDNKEFQHETYTPGLR